MRQRSARGRARARGILIIGLGAATAAAVAGCGFVPRTRLDDATKLVQGLRTENAQLKDANLGLKVQNQDLAQRAVDDAQAIRGLETANAQYERSIQGYQEDRDRIRAAFDDLKVQVRSATANR